MIHLFRAATTTRRRKATFNTPIRVTQPIAPTPAEIEAKRVLHADAQAHAGRVGHAVGISRC